MQNLHMQVVHQLVFVKKKQIRAQLLPEYQVVHLVLLQRV